MFPPTPSRVWREPSGPRMSWTPKKRFWTEVRVSDANGGYCVLLDGRPMRTPAKADLLLPTRTLALAVAQEWEAQEEALRPDQMPLTRASNSAIDKVTPNRASVADMIAEYGSTDMLCYREPHVQPLSQRQAADWDPWLDWAHRRFDVRLQSAAGVMHIDQPAEAIQRLTSEVHGYDPFPLTALHDLVTLSGSLILGLAIAEGALDAQEAWRISRLDEQWQEDLWGLDDEAQALTESRRMAFTAAAQLLDLLKGTGK